MEEKRKNKTLSNQGESKAHMTDNLQAKPARSRPVQPVSAKQSVDVTEQVQVREALLQSLEQVKRSQRMVLALSQAAQGISRARTIEGVYQAIQEQSSHLRYQATGLELTADSKLRIAFSGYKPGLIRKAEKLTGFSQHDYLFSPRKGSIYQRVLFQGETIYLQDNVKAVADALPSKMRKLARQIAELVGLAPTTFAPLIAGEETFGVLAFTGLDLTESDNPAITAFAGQAAIAMQNARLYETAQKEIAERKQAEKSLRESEERYRDLVENIQDLVCTHDLQGNILFVNQAPAILLGYAPNEWVGRNLRDLLSPKVRDQFDTYLSSIQRDGSASGFMRVLTRNGEERLWEYNNTLRTEGIDTPIVRGLARDVTERKRAEELLRESEERFRQMFDNMSSGAAVYEATKDGKDFILKDFNWAAERIEQVAKQDLIGNRVTQVFPGVVEFGLFEVFQRVWRTGVPEHHPISLYKDGRIAGWRENYIYKLPSGEIVAIYDDITERKRVEDALRESEERYRNIFNGVRDAIFVETLDGKILAVNDRACEMYGYTRAEFLTKSVADLVPEGQSILMLISKEIQSAPMETVNLRSNGERFSIEISGRVEIINGEELLLVIVRDITARKQVEDRLHQSEERYRLITNTVSDYVFSTMVEKDGSLKLNWVAGAFESITGYTFEEYVAHGGWRAMLHPDDREMDDRDLQTLHKNQKVISELRTLKKDGNVVWVRVYAHPVWDEQERRLTGIHGAVQGITEHKQAEAALAKERSLLHALTENIPDKIYFKDLESRFLLINRAQARAFGLSDPAQAIGKTDFDFFTEEHARPAYENEQAIIQSGQPLIGKEEKETWPDGQVGWALTTKMPLRDEKGNIIGTFGISKDITERKQAEAALRESEQRFRHLFVASPDALMLIDPSDPAVDWPIVDCNEIACQMNGYTREELIGRSVDLLNITKGTSQERAAYLDQIKRAGVLHLETFHRHRDGHIFPVETSTSIVTFKGRELVLGIDRDVTERKRAEEALAASEAELRALFASMQDVVLVIDREGVYRDIAPTDPSLLYKPPQELLGQSLRDIFPAEQAETFINVIRRTLDTGQTMHIEYELAIGERPTWFSTSISPMDADSTLWVAHDITEQKQAETEIRRRAEEFAALYDTSMNLSTEHDLNTLLQTIVENAATMLHTYAGGMYLYDPVREELEVTFTTDPSMPIGTRLRLGEGMAGRVAQTRQSMRIEDYSTWEGRSKKYEGTAVRATIEVPMLYKGELIGVLVAHETGASERQFTEADEHLLSLFAFQAAAAIQNTRLFEQERTSAHELSTLYEATKTISSDLALESVLETVAEKMAQISRSDGCTLSLLNHKQDAVITLVDHRSKHPDRAEAKDVIYYLNEYPASRRVLESGQPLTINSKDKEADQSELAHMAKRGLTTLLMLPLIAHNQVIGLVEVYEEEVERTYKQEEIQLLQSLAAQAAISIENARLFEDAQRRLRQTTALREIDQAIAGSMDIQHVLKVVLKHTISELSVDAAVILLYDPKEQSLHYELGSGFWADSLQHTRLRLGEGYAGRAALGKQTIYIPDLRIRNTDFLRSPTFHQEGFICYFGVPLIVKGEIMGVLEIFHRTALNPDIEWLGFMETLAGQVAIAIDNATLYKNLQYSNLELSLAYDATIEGWSRALDLRDRETEGHTLRVTELTKQMAKEMGISEEELVHIRRGALLHDIGKMGVPDRILLKPDTLTDEEWKIMHKHPIFAYEMLSPIGFLLPALDIPYCHHEKWDGTGYPRKLKGDDIPLVARIFAVVDVWDALTSNRPYRPAWTKEQALEYIQEQSGKHFDPKVVEVFLRLIAEE